MKGVNFGSSASKMRKLCVIGSPEYITVFLKTECNNRRRKKKKRKESNAKKKKSPQINVVQRTYLS